MIRRQTNNARFEHPPRKRLAELEERPASTSSAGSFFFTESCYAQGAMNGKPLIWIGLFLGSTIGGFLPELWHASVFSFSSIVFSAVGGFVGIWIGWKISGDYF